MEAFLETLLPTLLPGERTFEIHAFQGKHDLLGKLCGRMRGYRRWWVRPNVPQQARYRVPDRIKGGTWEAFERILQRHGYFETGLRKVEAARALAARMQVDRNRSRSFARFCQIITEATA